MAEARPVVLLIACPDRKGLVAAITRFIHENNGNILHLDQHVDMEANVFFARIEWDLHGFKIPDSRIADSFRSIADRYRMTWELHFPHSRTRMAIFVSKAPHCLYDILAHHEAGDWPSRIPLVISNHPDLEPVAKRHDIDFHCFPITKGNRKAQEKKEMELLREHGVELVVLARYMQILSPSFVKKYPNRIINIHHSFLPSFKGKKPYHQAYARGVKNIGATAHYVTADLDAGPILEQDVTRVSHRESIHEFIRRGKDLEKIVLSRAIWYHLQRKVIVYNRKTVIFS